MSISWSPLEKMPWLSDTIDQFCVELDKHLKHRLWQILNVQVFLYIWPMFYIKSNFFLEWEMTLDDQWSFKMLVTILVPALNSLELMITLTIYVLKHRF